MWSFGLLCLEVFTDADPYRTTKDHYVPVLLSKGKSPEHPGTAAVGLSTKMWELMQSCWEVDPAARPDMFKIQLAMRDILPRVEPRPTVIARRPSTSPVQIQPSIHVSPTTDSGSSHNGTSSESSSSFVPAPLTPPQPSGGLQLTLEPSPMKSSPQLSRLPELEGTGTLKRGSISQSLGSIRLPPLREDDYEPHSTGISIPPMAPPMAPLQLSRSSSGPSVASSLSPHPIVASDFPIRTSPTSSPPQSPTSTCPSEPTAPKRRFSLWRRSPSRSQSSTSRVRSQTNPAETLKAVPSRSSTILPTITTTRHQVPTSENVLRYLQSAASDPESLLRPARDGTVSAGNLEGLLNRAIVGSSDPSRDERFKAAFLTIYQLFATSEQVFEILKRRFKATSVDPSMASSRYL